MGKFGESSVTKEAQARQDEFVKAVFLSSDNETAREIIGKKYHISGQLDGLLYAHLLAMSRKEDISLRKLVKRAVEQLVIEHYGVYPAVAELKRFFAEEEVRKHLLKTEEAKKKLRKLITGK